MKRIVLGSLIAASVMFANTNNCPDLSKKTTNIGLSSGIKEALVKTLPIAWTLYSDALKNYNGTQDIDPYITEESLQNIGASVVWGELVRIQYELSALKDSKKYATDSKEIKNLENEYSRLLKQIEPNNSNWCNTLMSKETKQFMDAEIKSRITTK